MSCPPRCLPAPRTPSPLPPAGRERLREIMPKTSAQDPLLQSLEDQVLLICQQHTQGITNDDIFSKVPTDVKPANRATVYNKLLSKGRLRIANKKTKLPDGSTRDDVVYIHVSAEDAAKFRGLDATDRLVYDGIRKAAENGLTKRDIRFRTNIQNSTEIKQTVDRLMQRGLIKEIKSVQGANKRVYIASEFDPSVQHTGGPWYNDDQEYDTEFIEAMYAQVLSYMRRHPFITIDQVTQYVEDIKISNEKLENKDMNSLITTMLYDGTIEECVGPEENVKYYRPMRETPAVNHLTSVPCVWCPVFRSCVPGGVISPEKCLYMTEWLKDSIDW